MSKKYVVGHLNPDTDSVLSAITLAWFLNKKHNSDDYIPAVSGDINKETSFLLDYWESTTPVLITPQEADDKEFFLVDHNQLSQSIAKESNICGVVDHHLLGGLKTSAPIFFRCEPVGSSSTLIYKMIKESSLNIDKKIAGLLLSAIISDTLNLNSPTTTEEDATLLRELQQITGVDLNDLAQQMFAKKSDFIGRSSKEIIEGDLKVYEFGDKKIAIGVAETASLDYFDNNEEDIISTLKKLKEESGVDIFLFAAVDIVNQSSHFYITGEQEEKLLESVFSTERVGNKIILKGVSSRKKEIAPPISDYYEK